MSRLPQHIAAGAYQIALGGVNAFLIDVDDNGVATAARAAGGGIAPGGLVLVGAGVARSAARIGAAIRDLGRAPGDVRAIVVMHLHRDHTGALALDDTAWGEPWSRRSPAGPSSSTAG